MSVCTKLIHHNYNCHVAGAGKDTLQAYIAFHASLRAAHASFVSRLEVHAKGLLRHHLDAATGEFALALMASLPDLWSSCPQHEENDVDMENMPPAGGENAQDSGLQVWLCSQQVSYSCSNLSNPSCFPSVLDCVIRLDMVAFGLRVHLIHFSGDFEH